jgi:hypothetical protein
MPVIPAMQEAPTEGLESGGGGGEKTKKIKTKEHKTLSEK